VSWVKGADNGSDWAFPMRKTSNKLIPVQKIIRFFIVPPYGEIPMISPFSAAFFVPKLRTTPPLFSRLICFFLNPYADTSAQSSMKIAVDGEALILKLF